MHAYACMCTCPPTDVFMPWWFGCQRTALWSQFSLSAFTWVLRSNRLPSLHSRCLSWLSHLPGPVHVAGPMHAKHVRHVIQLQPSTTSFLRLRSLSLCVRVGCVHFYFWSFHSLICTHNFPAIWNWSFGAGMGTSMLTLLSPCSWPLMKQPLLGWPLWSRPGSVLGHSIVFHWCLSICMLVKYYLYDIYYVCSVFMCFSLLHFKYFWLFFLLDEFYFRSHLKSSFVFYLELY